MSHSPTKIIPFHTQHGRTSPVGSTLSVTTTRITALDICRAVYGDSTVSTPATNAFYESNAIYENPLLTATSRSVIGDIHCLTKQFSSIDVPRPLAALCTLLRLQPPKNAFFGWLSDEPLFRALRVWTDVEDICESESFDGHRKAIVEHIFHILFLPGIHLDGINQPTSTEPSDSLISPTHDCPMPPSQAPPSPPWLSIPGTSLSVPSPLHFKLHIVTRLSFNEQGLVTHHRDFWDVKDVLGLMPGASLAQWIGTRITAAGLSYASRILTRTNIKGTGPVAQGARYHSKPLDVEAGVSHPEELAGGTTKASEYSHLGHWEGV